MLASIRPLLLRSLMLGLLIGCGGDDVRLHSFQSPPPKSATTGTVATPIAITALPEPAVGTGGPSARIVSVNLVSSGAPSALDHVSESFTVLALASRGEGSSAAGPMRLELQLRGVTDTTLIEPLSTPVPLVIAHQFHVRVARTAGLRDGQYRATVRLTGPVGRPIATSIPVVFNVAAE